MESGQISPAARKRLEAQYESLNVAALHRRIEGLRDRLLAATEAKNSPEPAGRSQAPGPRHPSSRSRATDGTAEERNRESIRKWNIFLRWGSAPYPVPDGIGLVQTMRKGLACLVRFSNGPANTHFGHVDKWLDRGMELVWNLSDANVAA